MSEVRTRRLADGRLAEIREDRWRRGAYELVVDGTPQSHVDLNDPTEISFEYIQRMANVVDLAAAPRSPITAVHLGAGALTLPRYIDATRPGSRQQVIELSRELVDFVREELPWDRRASIRVRYGDAREALRSLPPAMAGSADVIVVDVFAGAQTPPHVTSVEFFRAVGMFLAPSGVVLVNVADGPPLRYARSQAVTLEAAIGPVTALAEASILKGRRFGNVVLAAAAGGLPAGWARALFAAGPHPAAVLSGTELRAFTAGAPVTTDETATGSPAPGKGVFRL
ncbi:MAG: fused MFS/spermidine synthase [Microbacterium sp.]|nr:fused MFS/spermidine synthase [Microbacterium sp.]